MNNLAFKTWREYIGVSQKDLHLLTGISQKSISLWETGNKEVPEPVIELIYELRDLQEIIEAELIEKDQLTITTFTHRAAMWQSDPRLNGLPTTFHRLAAARAARALEIKHQKPITFTKTGA